MFRIPVLGACSLLLSLCLAASAQADGTNPRIFGVWLAQSRDAHVLITHCGEAVCGKVLSASPARKNPQLLDVNNHDPALRGRHMVGLFLMDGFNGGPHKWTGGKLYNPGDGNFYHGALTLLDDDHLEVKGCALVILCKSQVWKRLE